MEQCAIFCSSASSTHEEMLHQMSSREQSVITCTHVCVCTNHVCCRTSGLHQKHHRATETAGHGCSIVLGGPWGKSPRLDLSKVWLPWMKQWSRRRLTEGQTGHSVTEIPPAGPHTAWGAPACDEHGSHLAKLFASLCAYSAPSDEEKWPSCLCTTQLSGSWRSRTCAWMRARKGREGCNSPGKAMAQRLERAFLKYL